MLACKLSWEVLGKDLARRGPYIQTVKDLHLARRGPYLAVVNLQTVWGVLKIHFELFWTFIQCEVDVANSWELIMAVRTAFLDVKEVIADPSLTVDGDLLTEDWSGESG